MSNVRKIKYLLYIRNVEMYRVKKEILRERTYLKNLCEYINKLFVLSTFDRVWNSKTI